jgi:hypothetical protein
MGRGSNNLNYDDGFKYERENYKIFGTSTKEYTRSKPTRRNQ